MGHGTSMELLLRHSVDSLIKTATYSRGALTQRARPGLGSAVRPMYGTGLHVC